MNWQSASPVLRSQAQACAPQPVWLSPSLLAFPPCVVVLSVQRRKASLGSPFQCPLQSMSANPVHVNLSPFACSPFPVLFVPLDSTLPAECQRLSSVPTARTPAPQESEAGVLPRCCGPWDLACSRCSINICRRCGWGARHDAGLRGCGNTEEEGSRPPHLAPVEERCPEEG